MSTLRAGHHWWRLLSAAALALALACGASVPAAWGQATGVPAGMVSVEVTSQAFDELMPWIKGAERTVQGNALVIEGQRLITTADLVKNANLIEVRSFGRYPDYAAEPVLVDYDLNLALLEVHDPHFWEGLEPLPLARNPVPPGRITISRWRGSGRIEQGTGEVVDFRVSNSPYGLMEFPVMRATTAMGGLGWAEVITAQGEVIGMITSHDGQQFEATTSDVLRLLAEAAGRTPFEGFAHRGFSWQQLNQPHLRAALGLSDSDTGVLVRRLFPGGTGADVLHPQDILHRINGYAIDPEGRIEHPVYGSVLFTIAINEKLTPTVEAEIQRDGKRMQVSLHRQRFDRDAYRIPPPSFGRPNDYEVFGGLVLQELTVGFLRAWGREWRTQAPARLVIEYSMHALREPDEPVERVVIISRVLPDPANIGYEEVTNAIVRTMNGRPVRSLKDVREAIGHPVDGYHTIGLLPASGRAKLVYDDAALDTINRRVELRYGVPARQREP